MSKKLTTIIILFLSTIQIQKQIKITFKKSKKYCFEIHLQKPRCKSTKRHIPPNHSATFSQREVIVCPGFTNLEDQTQMLGALIRLDKDITYKIPFNETVELIYESKHESGNCNYKGFKNYVIYDRFDEIKGVFDLVLKLNKINRDNTVCNLRFLKDLKAGYIFEDFRNVLDV